MTHSNDPSDGEAAELTRDEQRFVARVADVYRTPPLSPSRRVAFQTQLDARIARRRVARLFPALAGALVAAALTWLVLVGLGSPTDNLEGERPIAGVERPRAPAPASGTAVTAEEAILALSEDEEIEDESLPEEYVAIASLFLDS